MITFKEFLELAESSTPERGKRRLAPKGPLKNKSSRAAQRHATVDRVAMKKAGFRRSANQDYFPQDNQTSSSTHHDTNIGTYKNQSDFAKHNVKGKLKVTGRDETGRQKRKVVPTADRVRHLKALRKQLGGDRTPKQVHDVSIHAKDDKEHAKNDPKQLITRGKSFKKEIKSVPDAIKKVGGKAGDKVAGRPSEVQSIPDSVSAAKKSDIRKKGAQKRGKIYHKELGGSKTDRKTGLNVGTVR
jgi:hypothetical protein